MNLKSIWTALEESYNRFNGISFEGSMNTIAELNLPSDWFIWLVAVMFFGDEPISSGEFMRALPYGWQDALEERFASAARHGYLAGDGEGKYRPTEKGTDAVRRMVQADSDVVSPLQPIPVNDAKRLLSYLHRIADASLVASEPASKFIVSHKRNHMHPGKDASVNVLTVQYLNELEGFRTDAHSLAWQVHNIAGPAWDSFSHLWRNGVFTLEQIYETLQYNEVPKDVYAQALQELVNRGWVNNNTGAYELTDEGKRIREEAEALTDTYFFEPWSCLNESELEDMSNLATQLRDGLHNLKEQNRRHAMTNQLFPTGKFTYTVGEYSPVVDIYEQGKMTLSLEGEVIVVSKYQVMGDTLEVQDVEGAYAGPEYGVGKYKWNLEGNTLTFTLVEDKMPPRPKSFAVPWHKVE